MSELILVRGEITTNLIRARILMPLLFLGVVAIIWSGKPVLGILLAAIGIAAWIEHEVRTALLKARQTWIRDTDDGFDVIDRKCEFHVPDTSITALAVNDKKIHKGGRFQSTLREFTVWSDQVATPITLETRLQQNLPDPLATLTNRIWKQAIERAEFDLQTGSSLIGDDWQLDARSLKWGGPQHQESVEIREISSCQRYDGQICVWRRGQEEAVAKFPLSGRNVCLLPHFLSTAEDSEGMPDENTLGRLLFERRPNSTTRLLSYVGGSLLLILGVLLLLNRENLGETFLVAGALCVMWAYWKSCSVLQCRERGVHVAGILGQRQLRYTDVATFAYSTTRLYTKGIYTGTEVTLEFVPLAKVNARKVYFSTTFMNEDSDIEQLRNLIAMDIAHRMQARLHSGKRVRWTENLTFTPEGLEFQPAGFMGRKKRQLLSYADFGGHDVVDGVFYLFSRADKNPIMNEKTSAPNFFSGLLLLTKMQLR